MSKTNFTNFGTRLLIMETLVKNSGFQVVKSVSEKRKLGSLLMLICLVGSAIGRPVFGILECGGKSLFIQSWPAWAFLPSRWSAKLSVIKI